MKNSTIDRIEKIWIIVSFIILILGGLLVLLTYAPFAFCTMVLGFVMIAIGSFIFPSDTLYKYRKKLDDYNEWVVR